MLRIVVCAKQVLDPDAVNSYALAGRLEIGSDGVTLTQSAIPRLMNAYDEQAIEAALRLRDAGLECQIRVVSVGEDCTAMLRSAAALGADEIAEVSVDYATLDARGVARLLSAVIVHGGGADLVLCGRQASDDDQGVVPGLLCEALGMPIVHLARCIEAKPAQDSGVTTLRVTRVTPDGDEVVEGPLPAVVTITSELGEPRYPTAARKLKARRVAPAQLSPEQLGIAREELEPVVRLTRQFVPEVQGNCEFIRGETPAELAGQLMQRLREESALP